MLNGKLWIGIKNDIEELSRKYSHFIKSTQFFSSPKELIVDICLKENWDFEPISKKTSIGEIVFLRKICCSIASIYSLKNNRGWSLDDIGRVINKDHATVLHYKKIMCNLVETNDVLVENLENISFRYGIMKEDFIKYKRHSR